MRLGCLPYLNVKPLVYSFEKGIADTDVELVYATPSRLAQMLEDGSIDAAPVSSFATFSNNDLSICPGICIASSGPAASVLMFSKKRISEIGAVGIDTGSLSAANMLKIILAELYGIHPLFTDISPEKADDALQELDAVMMIGNPAMMYPNENFYMLDIGEEWKRLTGLPAVFAVWAGRRMTSELIAVLQESKKTGFAHLEEIAERESEQLGLPYDICLCYLRNIMIYDMGARELESLADFKNRAERHGLIPKQSDENENEILNIAGESVE